MVWCKRPKIQRFITLKLFIVDQDCTDGDDFGVIINSCPTGLWLITVITNDGDMIINSDE